MKRFKTVLAIVLVLLIVGNCSAQSTSRQASDSRSAQISQECRQAVFDAAKWEAEAQLLGKQVDELKAQVTAGKAETDKLREAVAKYEAANAAQDRADARVAELRLNYEKQIANGEKQLAIEQGKTNFWRTFAKLGIFAGVLVGGVLGYAVANK
jgi:triphosphoribosyl-dephospho-CoA synthetase